MTSTLSSDALVLVVDDETFARTLAVRILNKLGYTRIDTASDGSIALQKLKEAEQPFQIIICDLNMPQMDGVEFMSQLRGTDFAGGLILLSGEDQRMLDTVLGHAVAQNLNILGAIPKPLKPEPLNDLLSRYRNKEEQRQYRAEVPLTLAELKAGIGGDPDNYPVLVFQPKVEVATGKVSGVETLARWHHPERGLVGPGAFIPLAESAGLIDDLTRLIYQKAVEQTSQWHKQGHLLSTSVNISINSFTTPGFADFLVRTAENAGLYPGHIMLEATETQVMENAINCTEILMRLRLKKFGLSIDDFGTGNASMAQLMNIPFTEMKIDRSFVHDAVNNAGARAILEMSVALAKKLHMTIVAEGAETREDWNLVEALGCDFVQGYYCARPMQNSELLNFLAGWTGPH